MQWAGCQMTLHRLPCLCKFAPDLFQSLLFCACKIITYTDSPDVTSTAYVRRLLHIVNQKKRFRSFIDKRKQKNGKIPGVSGIYTCTARIAKPPENKNRVRPFNLANKQIEDSKTPLVILSSHKIWTLFCHNMSASRKKRSGLRCQLSWEITNSQKKKLVLAYIYSTKMNSEYKNQEIDQRDVLDAGVEALIPAGSKEPSAGAEGSWCCVCR